MQRLLRRTDDEDLLLRRKEGLQPFPIVADDGCRAGCGFEKTDAGRVANAHHVGACDVQSKPLGSIERAMLGRRQVLNALDIGWPCNRRGVLRSCHHKAPPPPAARRLEQQGIEGELPVWTIGAQISELPPRLARLWIIQLWIDGTVEGPRSWRPILLLEALQRRAASERQVQCVTFEQGRREIFGIATRQLGQ